MTSHISRSQRIAGSIAVAALLATGLTTLASGSAGATPAPAAPGAQALSLSTTQHADLLRAASADASSTAGKLGLGSQEKLIARDVIKDADGATHTRYERTYAGLPVLGGDLVVHTAKSGATSVTKATKSTIKVAGTTATVKPATAQQKALVAAKSAGSAKTSADQAPRKVIWAASGKPALAYETVVGGFQDDGTPSQLHVVTDATTGKKLAEWQAVKTGTGTSEYSGKVTLGTTKSGSNYTLNDAGRGGHMTYNLNHGSSGKGTLYSNTTDTWGNGLASNSETAAVDAHYGAAETWDFYKDVLKRNGIAGDGVASYSRVHYGQSYVNAFWDDSCFCMTYGDGEGNAAPLTAIDVAGHEMSHGLTAATANLDYYGESGGLNEATSDIFGTSVEFYANNTSDPGDYLIGEKIDINGDGSPLRYMDKPSKDGGSADYWSSSLGNLDVHYSSGPANHFFYLLSEGSGKKTINGVNYDSPTSDGSTVTGIGRDKAIQIWYKALSTYMTSTTNYSAARVATLKAASDLYGATSAEYKAVGAAWTGINVK
ncbi:MULTISPECIES: M4 family metallopeptidase [unclassified Streptomyces]|uniref:M4 family metallopeptidase n=1 Tax=unclassified Streptomyces TaxID=2593676 RepID=UPI002024D407|nr:MULTISPECIES: M4 family metallopeptidase [unclassified Streptomyces]MCX4548080.1 M4 family metallopeptidase [Streptomyces sp. NBC_01500]WSC19744.1 M4 family metallopeptidase [Streptomyces sp. NBC_01766]WSV53768.1 M4 family metallopeptidase [Streptomyces sp. NBC_01014]